MSDARENLSSPFPILALLLIALGVIAPRIPLQSARPAESDRLAQVPAPSVPSRLWQDPMAAVELGRDDSGAAQAAAGSSGSVHADLSNIGSDVGRALRADGAVESNDDERLLIVPVMLSATPFRDDAEQRRRTRYAVVSGLLAEGFAPADAERISFVCWCPRASADRSACGAQPDVASCAANERVLPYEVFKRQTSVDDGDRSGAKDGVKSGAGQVALVLWLGEADFYEDPLWALQKLTSEVVPRELERKAQWRTAVVGPATSTLYVSLLSALRRRESPSPIPAELGVDRRPTSGAERVRFYSYGATIPSDAAAREAFGSGAASDGGHESVVRVIGADDQLVDALFEELDARHVNARRSESTEKQPCRDQIVLLVEADYAYGRALGNELAQSVREKCADERDADADAAPVLVFDYFRGVDGQLPTVPGHRQKDEPSADSRREQGEHAEGHSQYDYLQRVVDRVVEINAKGGTDRRVRAIGIFGSDVYDKLLILQAMRPRIRDAVYFTTDLDARFLHRDQRRWTHNLLVASHFGLALHPEIQDPVPAFRSDYQTAAYLATRLAVGGSAIDTSEDVGWRRGKPRSFEIGRTRAVDLTTREDEACKTWPSDCGSFHPPPSDDVGRVHWPHGLAIAVLGTLVVLLTTRANRSLVTVEHWLELAWARRKRLLVWLVPALVAALAAAWIVGHVGRWLASQYEGEPIVWLQGVSALPSHVIRFLALLSALALGAVGLVRLRRRAHAIALALGLPEPGAHSRARRSRPSRASDDGPRWPPAYVWRRRIDWLRGPFVDFTRTERLEPGSESEERVSVDRLWQRYLDRTSGVGFWSWIALATALFGAFAGALYLVDPPFFPHRGQHVVGVNDLLWAANVAVLWATIFWTVFEARACVHLVNRLSAARSSWPATTLERRREESGVPEVLLVESLDFELIVRAVGRVNPIVYVPFVQIFLLGFALHPIFDDSDLPLPLVVVAALSLLYVLYAMLVLRRAAERAKRTAIAHYQADLLRLEDGEADARPSGYAETRGPDGCPEHAPLTLDQLRACTRKAAPAQIRMLVERIDTTREGPFRPLLQQPFLRAVLIPFSGWSGVSLIEPLLNYFGV